MKIGTTVLLLALGFAAAGSAAEDTARSHKRTLRNPELHTLHHSDVSRPLRDMPIVPPLEEEEERVRPAKPNRPRRPVPPGWVDPLASPMLQAVAPQLSTTPGLSFDGVGVGLGSYVPSTTPPDTNGAAGATQYVQWVNTSFAVFDKATGALLFGPAAGNTLWQGFGGACEATNSGDPIVMYDKAASRWVMTQISINPAARQYYQCVAVSTTPDATGSYRRFAYNFAGLNDYPKGGVWPDGYYLTFNMLDEAGTAWVGSRVCVLDRDKMVTPSGTPDPIQCFQLTGDDGGMLPADLDGSTPPPSGSPNYLVALDRAGSDGLNLWKFHVDWTNAANTTLIGPIKIPAAAFSLACGGADCIDQPGTSTRLASMGHQLMFRLAYRNLGSHEALVMNHSVAVSGTTVSGVRWYEVRNPGGTPVVFQSGTHAPDATARWMGSIAQDRQGNMLLGYSASSGSVRPSIRYTGRLADDPPTTMRDENTLITSTGSQTGTDRWGDYSSMTIDPVDDCTFWFTTEYLRSTGSNTWSTRVGAFRFPGCAPPWGFTVSVSPGSLSIGQWGIGIGKVTVSSVNGFSSGVTLSCAGLPAGVNCFFDPPAVTPPANGSATSTLMVGVAPFVAVGGYSVQVRGLSSALSHGTPLSLTVTPSDGGPQTAVYEETFKAPFCAVMGSACDSGSSVLLGRGTKGPEPNQPNTLAGSCADGDAGTFHSDESNDRIRVSTLDGTLLAWGQTVRIDATVWAWTTPSADHLDLYYTANAASPEWTFLSTLTPTTAGAQTLSATYTLPVGTLQAVRARFRYNGSALACSTGPYDDHDDLVFLVNP